jgi:PAS domain S-box-containing protein
LDEIHAKWNLTVFSGHFLMLFPWQVAVMLAAGCVTLVLACVSQTHRRLLVANPFSGACLIAACWCFLYSWELRASSLDEKVFILKLGFTVVPFLPAFALELTYRFVHERPLLKGWLLGAILIVPAVTVFLGWTINASPVFRYDFRLDESGTIPVLQFRLGPWSPVFYAYCYLLSGWSFVILVRSLDTASPWVRRARIAFLVAKVIPLAFDILFHLRALAPAGMNYAPASLALSDVLMGFILFGDRQGFRGYVVRSGLIERISDLLIVLDARGRVLDINAAAASFLGTTLRAIQGQPASKLFQEWEDVLEALDEARSGPVEVERGDRCFEMSLVPLRESERRDSGIQVLWMRDISRRKRAEQAHVMAAAEAIEANRAKDRYLAIMSHEIRGPLNSVLGFMQLLEHTSLDAEQKEYVGYVSQCGANLLAVINEILDFSKIEAGHMVLVPAPFDFREEVAGLCNGLKVEAEAKGLSFSFQTAAGVPKVLVGDKLRILQILRNLISNAIKFTSEGGVEIRFDCADQPREGSECVLRMAVSDTGIGMDSLAMKSLFQPFAQAGADIQHQYGGTGLGLVIAKRFAEMMRGSISVESAPGEGSTFTCLLRLGIGFGGEEEASSSEQRFRSPEKPLHFLIVDDQVLNRRLLQIMLGRMKHKSTTVGSGAECLEKLRGEQIDIVILDVEMPGLDGFETARRIRGLAGSTPTDPYIIALSAHASADIRQQCLDAGMNDYLSKPITRAALSRAIETAMASIGDAYCE